MIIMAGITRRPFSAERSIEVRTVKFTKARNRTGDRVHVIDGARLWWLSGMFEETAVIVYYTKCGYTRLLVEPVPVSDQARVTCPGCQRWIKKEREA